MLDMLLKIELKKKFNILKNCRKIGCPVIDVSDKAIEETANDVIQIIESKA